MKHKHFAAFLLAALLLVPAARCEQTAYFTIEQTRLLQGMNRTWQQGYEPSITGNKLTLVLPIVSKQAQGSIRTELIIGDTSVSPFKPQTMRVSTERTQSGLYAVRLMLELYQDRRNGDYECVIRVSGTTKAGKAIKTDIPYTLRIRDGLPCRETVRMRVQGVASDLRVGEDGVVTATLVNPCRTVRFEQIALRVSDESGQIIPQSADVLYIDNIAPGGRAAVSFPLTVRAGAAVAPHRLRFSLEYQALGQTVTQTEGYTVPVTQDMRLEQGGLKMAGSVVAGDSVALSLPLMNMGKADIINTLVTLQMPGVAQRQSVLVGTLAPGETKQAQMTVMTDKALSGDFSGTLNVSATDNDGNPVSFSLPVSLTVEAPVAIVSADAPQTAPTEKPPYLASGLGIGCALLLTAFILQGIALRGKIRRLEEEKL